MALGDVQDAPTGAAARKATASGVGLMPEFAVDSASRFDFHLQPFLGLGGGLFNQSDYIGFDVSRAPLPSRQDNPAKCAQSRKAVHGSGAHP